MTLEEVISGISQTDPAALQRALQRWDGLAKPLGSLGSLERSIAKLAALTGQEHPRLENATLLVFCADNGVTAQGVSQSDASVTAAVAAALGAGTSTVSYMAREARCRVVPVNIGMAVPEPLPGVRQCCIRRGTGDISRTPAMTREECEAAILCAFELVREEAEKGTEILLLGEMGIGNTTTSAAVACALLKAAPELLAGRGAGLSDAGFEKKKAAIRAALALHRPEASDPIGILSGVGGLDLAGLCGACLGGAYFRIPILLDGVIASAAALCAVRLCPVCADALLASHVSEEPAGELLLREMHLEAPIRAGLRLGEGTGAMLCLPLLRQTLAVYNSGHTFSHLGIDAYLPQ